ncbi:hypothetical protein HMPREF9074_09454 [Capnocytophaga sp. oral taxon 329 str. F0087]|nr:hypothetical protein HMPREF9074_09454 [Capnocytophaga sp. oral taxon 329 str. F0087]
MKLLLIFESANIQHFSEMKKFLPKKKYTAYSIIKLFFTREVGV